MLVLETCDNNELTMQHQKSGKEITFYYRDPSPEEQIAFSNSIVSRKGNKVKFDQGGVRLRGGLKVLTGFPDGTLGVRNKKKEVEPISSDPKSPDYRDNWKEIAKRHLSQEIMLLGAHVFESTTIESDSAEEAEEDPLVDDTAHEEDIKGNSIETLPQ